MNLGESRTRDNSLLSSQTPNIFDDKDFLDLSNSLKQLTKRYKLPPKKILSLAQTPNTDIPLSVFSNKQLSSFELIVKYLHEEKNYNYAQIATITNRDQRSVWCTYNNAKKKFSKKLTVTQSLLLPLSIIHNRDFSVLESIVGFLKEEANMTLAQIAAHLRLDQRTVWTCYNRLKIKRKKQ